MLDRQVVYSTSAHGQEPSQLLLFFLHVQIVAACTKSRDLEHLLAGLDTTLSEGGCEQDSIIIGAVIAGNPQP